MAGRKGEMNPAEQSFNEVLSRSPRELGNDCEEEMFKAGRSKKRKERSERQAE